MKPEELFVKRSNRSNESKSSKITKPEQIKNTPLKRPEEKKSHGKYLTFDEFLSLDGPTKVTQNFIVEHQNSNNSINDTPLRKLQTIKEKKGIMNNPGDIVSPLRKLRTVRPSTYGEEDTVLNIKSEGSIDDMESQLSSDSA